MSDLVSRVDAWVAEEAGEETESACDLLFEAVDEIKRLREAVRVRGGCRVLSDGDECDCGLCVRDKEIERLRAEITQILDEQVGDLREVDRQRDEAREAARWCRQRMYNQDDHFQAADNWPWLEEASDE